MRAEIGPGHKEQWKTIPGFPKYEISDLGRVLSNWPNSISLMKLALTPEGYLRVGLRTEEGVTKTLCVHRLVLTAFVGPCPQGEECRHLNGTRTDNRLKNLCWGTRKDNLLDRIRHGTLPSGSVLNERKLSEARRLLSEGRSINSIAFRFGVRNEIISRLAWEPIGSAQDQANS